MGQDQDKKINIDVGFWLMVAAVLLAAILLLAPDAPPEPQIPEQPALKRAAEKVGFQRLLAKHGLDHDVSIIYEDHLGRYFIRGGQRCAFK